MPAGDDASGPTVQEVLQRGMALRGAGRWQNAAEAFDEVLARLEDRGGAADVARMKVVWLKLGCVHEQGDAAGVLAGAEAVLSSELDGADPWVDRLVADTLWLKGRAYSMLGERELERSVLREIIVRYRDEVPPRSQLARALYNEGIHCRDDGDGEKAIALWDELFSRFISHPPTSDPFIPIRGLLAKSDVLARTGQLDAVLRTCERMRKECERLDLGQEKLAEVHRAQHQCVALAQRSNQHSRLSRLIRRR